MAITYNSNYDGTMPFSDVCSQINCAANTEEVVTIPGLATTQYQALMSYTEGSNVFVCKNATPTIPASGTVGSQQYNEFRPLKRYVNGGDTLHFITPDTTAYIGLSLRQLNQT